MASNETVATIATAMRRMETVFRHLYWCEYADRIEAAHKREIAAKDAEIKKLRKCLKEAVEREGNRNTCYPRCAPKIECRACVITKWRKALEGGNDAH